MGWSNKPCSSNEFRQPTKIWRASLVVLLGMTVKLSSTAQVESAASIRAALQPRVPQAACSIKDPPPTNSICGIAGKLLQPTPLCNPSSYNTYEECRDLCSRKAYPPDTTHNDNPGCVSFSFTASTGECNLYQLATAKQKFQETTRNKTLFYDLTCFDCPPQCPSQPFHVNLIDNGDFERSLLGPWRQHKDGSVKNGLGFNSTRGFMCTKSGCEIDQSFVTCKHSFYRLAFNFKIDSLYPHRTRNELDVSTDGFSSFHEPRYANWKFREIWFQAPHDKINNVDFYFYRYFQFPRRKYKHHTYYIDNVRVERIPGSFAPAVGAKERLRDGGFEASRFRWSTQGGTFSYASPGISGTRSLRFDGTHPKGSFAYLSQNVYLTVGKVYLLQFKMRKENPSAKFGSLTVDGISPALPATQIANDTLTYQLPFRAQGSDAELIFAFHKGPLLMDDVSIRELAPAQPD